MKTLLVALSFFVSSMAFSLTNLTDQNYKEELKGANGVVAFYADWCPACKQYMPIFKKVEKDYPTLKFMVVDVDAQPGLGRAAPSIPTTFLIINGKRVGGVVGSGTEEQVRNLFDKFLAEVNKLQK